MRRSIRFLPIILAALAACSSSEDDLSLEPEAANVSADTGQTFELKAGQTARVGNAGLVIGFRGVASDSRCPVDVTCVWQGDAELRMQASMARRAWTPLTLHTGVEPRSAQFQNYTITVVSLTPEPREGQRIPSDRYTVTLRVE